MDSFSDPLPEKDGAYLLETAEEFYWNDLEWEELTGEEKIDEEFLTELAFPGFLASSVHRPDCGSAALVVTYHVLR